MVIFCHYATMKKIPVLISCKNWFCATLISCNAIRSDKLNFKMRRKIYDALLEWKNTGDLEEKKGYLYIPPYVVSCL